MPVEPIPPGYRSVTPYLVVDGAAQLIDFLTSAFGAAERMRMPTEEGKIAHAEVEIGDSVVMLADATPEYPPGNAMVHLYVEDVDGVYQRALSAGATSQQAPEDQFYGDRAAVVNDGLGNSWSIATHVEDVDEDEMMRRAAARQG